MESIATEAVTQEEIAQDQVRQQMEDAKGGPTEQGEQGDDSDQPTNGSDLSADKELADQTDPSPDPSPDSSTPEPPARSFKVTPELLEQMNHAYNYWHTHGYPEKAAVLYECIQQKRRPPADLLPSDGGVTPETSVDPKSVKLPARAGPDASTDSWRAFAKKVIDMEPEIIDNLGRSDIIKMLEEKGVIEKESE